MQIEALKLLAVDWVGQDPDPETRAAVAQMVADDDEEALAAAFGSRLQFGTAGLRGRMGPGTARMNRLLVRHVTAGLAAHVLTQVDDATDRGVVVAYDGRHRSRVFAEDAARVLASRGFRVFLADRPEPTPFLAFAVVSLDAAAGVMITASHNPPADNGYKVFWSNGAQIVPPHDAAISAAIDRVEDVGPLPRLEDLGRRVQSIPDTVAEEYAEEIADLRVHDDTGVTVVYTAMHGVGCRPVLEALAAAGHTDVHPVAEQAEPDGDFPTVDFPNPEEPGALDLALAKAREVGADVVIANDPDADRLAVALPGPDGAWHALTGNQVGVLLADDLLTHGDTEGRQPLVATTIVSTRMLQRLAEAHGATYAETLTGFKWIANRAIAHDRAGGAFVLGFEEALGYSAGSVVRDKDGVSAAMLLVDLVAWCKARGETLWDRLADLYARFGLHTSLQRSVKLPGAEGKARIAAAMQALRDDPPTAFGGRQVVRTLDLLTGEGRDASGEPVTTDLPRSNVLAFTLDDGSQVLARPSGTEPKLKFYVELVTPVPEGIDFRTLEASATAEAEAMAASLVATAGLDG